MRCFILIALASIATAQPVLRFKVPLQTAKIKTDSRTSQIETPAVYGPGHLVIQFAKRPAEAQLDALRARGASVLQDVPDDAVLVYAAEGLDLTGLEITYAAPLAPQQKLSPLLPAPGASFAGGTYIVEFHPDVDLNEARRLLLNPAAKLALELRENPDLGPHRLMVRTVPRPRSPDPLLRMAGLDQVAYIFPASAELVSGHPVVPCMGAVTENGGMGQYIATYGSGWDGPGLGSAALNYVFGAVADRLSPEQAQAEILRAMQEWSRAVQISWQPGASATAARTLHIFFARGSHGDNYPFDGPGKVLAHTFYPAPPNPEPIAGDMHLDADEDWRVGANMDLYSVVLHELGHALGLGHSDDPSAVMYPYYRMATSLSAADVAAIRTLYAAQTGTPTPPAPPTTPTTPTPPSTPTPPTTPSTPQPPPPPTTPTTPTVPTTPTTPTPPTTPSNPAPPAPGDTTPPALSITSPGSTSLFTTAAAVVFSGTASDSGGLAGVTWSTNLGKSGPASGTTRWTAQIPLLVGINRVTIRATDTAGNSSWRTVVVTRR